MRSFFSSASSTACASVSSGPLCAARWPPTPHKTTATMATKDDRVVRNANAFMTSSSVVRRGLDGSAKAGLIRPAGRSYWRTIASGVCTNPDPFSVPVIVFRSALGSPVKVNGGKAWAGNDGVTVNVTRGDVDLTDPSETGPVPAPCVNVPVIELPDWVSANAIATVPAMLVIASERQLPVSDLIVTVVWLDADSLPSLTVTLTVKVPMVL